MTPVTPERHREAAAEFARSARGQFIISQALFLASRELAKVPEPIQETSNLNDMEFLLEWAYPTYPMVEQVSNFNNTQE